MSSVVTLLHVCWIIQHHNSSNKVDNFAIRKIIKIRTAVFSPVAIPVKCADERKWARHVTYYM